MFCTIIVCVPSGENVVPVKISFIFIFNYSRRPIHVLLEI